MTLRRTVIARIGIGARMAPTAMTESVSVPCIRPASREAMSDTVIAIDSPERPAHDDLDIAE